MAEKIALRDVLAGVHRWSRQGRINPDERVKLFQDLRKENPLEFEMELEKNTDANLRLQEILAMGEMEAWSQDKITQAGEVDAAFNTYSPIGMLHYGVDFADNLMPGGSHVDGTEEVRINQSVLEDGFYNDTPVESVIGHEIRHKVMPDTPMDDRGLSYNAPGTEEFNNRQIQEMYRERNKDKYRHSDSPLKLTKPSAWDKAQFNDLIRKEIDPNHQPTSSQNNATRIFNAINQKFNPWYEAPQANFFGERFPENFSIQEAHDAITKRSP